MKPFFRTHSMKYSGSFRIKEIEKSKQQVNRKAPNSADNAEREIRSSWHNNELDNQPDKDLQTATDMNNSAILPRLKETEWSYENYGFYSLPSRGYKKSKRPNIKIVINSDTVSQTKTLFYRDYHQFNHFSNSNCEKSNNPSNSNSGSSSSLNSNDDPEIVAAIDQIASQMGLIDGPVSRQSNDPLHYLLATRSFSERISKNRNSFKCNLNVARPHSLSNYSKPASPDAKLKVKENLPNGPSNQEANKKQSKISKFIQRLSPKLHRRSKSISCVERNLSCLVKSDLQIKTSIENRQNVSNQEVALENIEPTISSESAHSQYSEKIIKPQFISVSSNRLLNSLKMDRIEEPQNKFRNMNRKRIEEKSNIPVTVELRKKDLSVNIPENYSLISDKIVEYDLKESLKRPVSANASYVNISLSAFGYGAHQSVYKSPIDRKPLSLLKDRHKSSVI